jgi:DNA polymerase-3 subunit chi
MTTVMYYELNITPMEKVLPQLLLKMLSANEDGSNQPEHRAMVLAESSARVDELNTMLFTFSTNKFIPHGTAKDGFADRQPVWITDSSDNANGAKNLFITHLNPVDFIGNFSKCVRFFDGSNPIQTEAAKKLIANDTAAGMNTQHWRQTKSGWDRIQ